MSTYTQKGKKQDLSDIVKNLTPYETPFQSMIGSERAGNTLFNWVEESLNGAADNAQVEGADAIAATVEVLAERQNYTQIFEKVVSLSTSEQATKQAGGIQTMAHKTQQRSKELKRDVEYAYVGTAQAAAAGTAATARKTAGYQAQIDVANVKDLAGAAVTEADFNALLGRLYDAGANPDVVMTSASGKLALDAALQKDRIRDIGQDQKATYGVSVYVSPFGAVEIVPNRFVKQDTVAKTGDILVMDSTMWAEKVLEDVTMSDLAKTGLSDKKMIHVEKGLMHRNFKSSGLMTNVKFG